MDIIFKGLRDEVKSARESLTEPWSRAYILCMDILHVFNIPVALSGKGLNLRIEIVSDETREVLLAVVSQYDHQNLKLSAAGLAQEILRRVPGATQVTVATETGRYCAQPAAKLIV